MGALRTDPAVALRPFATRSAARALVSGLLLGVPSPLAAQLAERSSGGWAALGIGAGVPYELSVTGSLAGRFERMVVRTRFATAGEILGNSREDVGLLVGYVISPASIRSQFALGAGVGRVSGTNGCVLCGSSATPATWGLLFDLEVLVSVTNFFGIQIYPFADFNSFESFGGVTLGLYFGRF